MKVDFKKLSVIFLLVLLVLGFTLPGIFFFVGDQDSQYGVEDNTRVCAGDSDCTLVCDDVEQVVLCYRNTCQKNSCDEVSYIEYESVENKVLLEITAGNETLDLSKHTSLFSDNLYVTFEDNHIVTHAEGLTLNHILDKLSMALTPNCLVLGRDGFCEPNGELSLIINGQRNDPYGEYVVQDGDELGIVFVPLNSTT
tara:strand:- start:3697 stop:4287 length:591 start_codon:yes stop_codon:yes gene_type:complete